MGSVVNRTTVEYLASVNTPDYSPATWIINPDLSLLLDIIPWKYWKVVGDTVVEMDQGEKDDVDEVISDETHHQDFSFRKDFIGSEIDTNFWDTILSGANSDVLNAKRVKGGVLTLKSGDATDRFAVLAQGNKAVFLAKSFALETRLETAQLADSDTEFGVCLDTVTELMNDDVIKFTRSGTGNWFAKCISSSTTTSVDTGVAAVDDEYIVFKIKGIKGTIQFFIDDVLKATIDTNVPSGMLEMHFGQKTTAGTATRICRLDWVAGSSREA